MTLHDDSGSLKITRQDLRLVSRRLLWQRFGGLGVLTLLIVLVAVLLAFEGLETGHGDALIKALRALFLALIPLSLLEFLWRDLLLTLKVLKFLGYLAARTVDTVAPTVGGRGDG